MLGRHERTNGVSSVFMIVLVVWAVWAETCEDLQCLNSNPCQTWLRPQDNSTGARCVCGGRWAGPRCQHPIRLQPQAVTSSQARLTVQVMMSEKDDAVPLGSSSAMSLVSKKEERREVKLNYTLVYWRRNDTLTSLALDASFVTSGEVSCVLLHNRHSRQPVLGGLKASTRYTICVESGFVDSCVLSSFTDATPSSSASSSSSSSFMEWPSNCVTIYTPEESPAPIPLPYTSTVSLVAVASVFVLGILLVVFVVFLLRRHNVAFRLFLDSACGRLCCWSSCCERCCSCCPCYCCCCCARDSGGDSQDRRQLSPSSSSSAFSSRRPRSVFLDDDGNPEKAPKKSLFKRASPQKKNNKKQKQLQHKSSTYTSASMLLGPPPLHSNAHEAFTAQAEAAPLGFDLEEEEGGEGEDSVFENSVSGTTSAPVVAVALPTLRNKPRHKLSRKRRGYVTYSRRKDKNIRLTTVLESTTGDDDEVEFEADALGCGHSSI